MDIINTLFRVIYTQDLALGEGTVDIKDNDDNIVAAYRINGSLLPVTDATGVDVFELTSGSSIEDCLLKLNDMINDIPDVTITTLADDKVIGTSVTTEALGISPNSTQSYINRFLFNRTIGLVGDPISGVSVQYLPQYTGEDAVFASTLYTDEWTEIVLPTASPIVKTIDNSDIVWDSVNGLISNTSSRSFDAKVEFNLDFLGDGTAMIASEVGILDQDDNIVCSAYVADLDSSTNISGQCIYSITPDSTFKLYIVKKQPNDTDIVNYVSLSIDILEIASSGENGADGEDGADSIVPGPQGETGPQGEDGIDGINACETYTVDYNSNIVAGEQVILCGFKVSAADLRAKYQDTLTSTDVHFSVIVNVTNNLSNSYSFGTSTILIEGIFNIGNNGYVDVSLATPNSYSNSSYFTVTNYDQFAFNYNSFASGTGEFDVEFEIALTDVQLGLDYENDVMYTIDFNSEDLLDITYGDGSSSTLKNDNSKSIKILDSAMGWDATNDKYTTNNKRIAVADAIDDEDAVNKGQVENYISNAKAANLYLDGTDWKYTADGVGLLMTIEQDGTHIYSAPTGVADAIATLTKVYSVDEEGNISGVSVVVSGGGTFGEDVTIGSTGGIVNTIVDTSTDGISGSLSSRMDIRAYGVNAAEHFLISYGENHSSQANEFSMKNNTTGGVLSFHTRDSSGGTGERLSIDEDGIHLNDNGICAVTNINPDGESCTFGGDVTTTGNIYAGLAFRNLTTNTNANLMYRDSVSGNSLFVQSSGSQLAAFFANSDGSVGNGDLIMEVDENGINLHDNDIYAVTNINPDGESCTFGSTISHSDGVADSDSVTMQQIFGLELSNAFLHITTSPALTVGPTTYASPDGIAYTARRLVGFTYGSSLVCTKAGWYMITTNNTLSNDTSNTTTNVYVAKNWAGGAPTTDDLQSLVSRETDPADKGNVGSRWLVELAVGDSIDLVLNADNNSVTTLLTGTIDTISRNI